MTRIFPNSLYRLFIAQEFPRSWQVSALTLALRLLFGWQFLQTGLGKLRNIDGVIAYFGSLSIAFPAATAWSVASLEALGGVMLLLGLAVRPHALALIAVLTGALATAHAADLAKEGLDALFTAPPFPFLLACLCIATLGAGEISLDRFLRSRAETRTPAGSS